MEIITLAVASLTLVAVTALLMNKKEVVRPKTANRAVVDTCALIDGRILEIAKIGFLPHEIIVPKFVVAELQLLADTGGAHKRERARYGLEVVKELQDTKQLEVTIMDQDFPDLKEVDDKLVALAKKQNAVLFTTDFNLNKVAAIDKVRVLNVNELSQQLRPIVLPGESKEIKIVQRGNERSQGLGYLEDGTMVVIEEGAKHMNETVTVEFQRSLQTVAGKMLFANIKSVSKKRRHR